MMTLLKLILLAPLTACSAKAVSPSATPAPVVVQAPAKPEFNLPPEPTPIRDKNFEYSIRTDVQVCSGRPGEKCLIDTLVVAKSADNGELVWDRRIYFRTYEFNKDLPSQIIAAKLIAFKNKKMILVKNARGDSFELETGHGHLKSPKQPKEYSK